MKWFLLIKPVVGLRHFPLFKRANGDSPGQRRSLWMCLVQQQHDQTWVCCRSSRYPSLRCPLRALDCQLLRQQREFFSAALMLWAGIGEASGVDKSPQLLQRWWHSHPMSRMWVFFNNKCESHAGEPCYTNLLLVEGLWRIFRRNRCGKRSVLLQWLLQKGRELVRGIFDKCASLMCLFRGVFKTGTIKVERPQVELFPLKGQRFPASNKFSWLQKGGEGACFGDIWQSSHCKIMLLVLLYFEVSFF